jgi:hypothetical protein
MTLLVILLVVVLYVAAAVAATNRVLASADLEQRQKVILIGGAWALPFVGAGLVWGAKQSGLLGDLPRFSHDPYVQSALADAADHEPMDSGPSDGGGGD